MLQRLERIRSLVTRFKRHAMREEAGPGGGESYMSTLAQLAEDAFADHDPVPPAAHLTDFSERKVDEIREKSMAKIRRPIPRLPTPEVSLKSEL